MNRGMEKQQDASEELCKLCRKQHQHISAPAQWRNKRAQELATTLNVTNGSMCLSAVQTGHQ